MRRAGLCLILMGVLATPAAALAGDSGPFVAVRKVEGGAAEQRAVMVQISNPSARPICIARDFSSLDRLTFWRNGRQLVMKRQGARARPAPGCALLPPGRSRTTLFRPWRSAAPPGGAGMKMCYRISWRNDDLTSQAPDMTRDICEAFR